MKKISFLFIVAIFAGALLAGCMDETEQTIQGTWEFNYEHLDDKASESHLTIIWYFSNGSFTYQACCFNQDEEITGRYRILDVEDDIITIQLYNTRGASFRTSGDIRIVIDRENDELDIQGSGPYHRLSNW